MPLGIFVANMLIGNDLLLLSFGKLLGGSCGPIMAIESLTLIERLFQVATSLLILVDDSLPIPFAKSLISDSGSENSLHACS